MASTYSKFIVQIYKRNLKLPRKEMTNLSAELEPKRYYPFRTDLHVFATYTHTIHGATNAPYANWTGIR